ncbi:hypothetical protein QQS21_007737 [Conoideocrella luteorostrata]|uniref:Uncharacterized protein n=1 Tax=Conoideocrella luteorostrata TaxID=1105319 RepID=A0AAJ0CKK0_9HYPO|nr:hypothetical protein QQS21_007737 [Conoideocrella luteorostrata]
MGPSTGDVDSKQACIREASGFSLSSNAKWAAPLNFCCPIAARHTHVSHHQPLGITDLRLAKCREWHKGRPFPPAGLSHVCCKPVNGDTAVISAPTVLIRQNGDIKLLFATLWEREAGLPGPSTAVERRVTGSLAGQW